MQAIADWLEKLGMSKYAQRFAENDIDFTILGDLTDQDLEKIGVGRSDIAANCFAPLPTSRTSRRAVQWLRSPQRQLPRRDRRTLPRGGEVATFPTRRQYRSRPQ